MGAVSNSFLKDDKGHSMCSIPILSLSDLVCFLFFYVSDYLKLRSRLGFLMNGYLMEGYAFFGVIGLKGVP